MSITKAAEVIPTRGANVTIARAPYFVYGSLMSSNILFRIIAPHTSELATPKTLKATQMTRATLYGYKRFAVKYADFPAIAKTGNAEDFVEGYLVSGLTRQQESRVEWFEAGLYDDEAVEVTIGWGGTRRGLKVARCYVWGGSRDELVDTEVREWSFAKFKKSGMYMRSFTGSASEDEDENEGVSEE